MDDPLGHTPQHPTKKARSPVAAQDKKVHRLLLHKSENLGCRESKDNFSGCGDSREQVGVGNACQIRNRFGLLFFTELLGDQRGGTQAATIPIPIAQTQTSAITIAHRKAHHLQQNYRAARSTCDTRCNGKSLLGSCRPIQGNQNMFKHTNIPFFKLEARCSRLP